MSKEEREGQQQRQVAGSVGTVVGVDGGSSQLETPSPWSLVYLLTLCQVLDGMWTVGHQDI
jgi:hypothetical protein